MFGRFIIIWHFIHEDTRCFSSCQCAPSQMAYTLMSTSRKKEKRCCRQKKKKKWLGFGNNRSLCATITVNKWVLSSKKCAQSPRIATVRPNRRWRRCSSHEYDDKKKPINKKKKTTEYYIISSELNGPRNWVNESRPNRTRLKVQRTPFMSSMQNVFLIRVSTPYARIHSVSVLVHLPSMLSRCPYVLFKHHILLHTHISG